MQHCSHLYQVLGLPYHPWPNLTPEKLKTAYHAALLRNHPDKSHGVALVASGTSQRSNARKAPIFSVDEIIVAYQTLLKSIGRAVHDSDIESTNFRSTQFHPRKSSVHAGVETYDLDDLTFVASTNEWHKRCRCGDNQGYVLEEAELDGEDETGEIYVGCKGCSLFIKVLFEVVEEEEAENASE